MPRFLAYAIVLVLLHATSAMSAPTHHLANGGKEKEKLKPPGKHGKVGAATSDHHTSPSHLHRRLDHLQASLNELDRMHDYNMKSLKRQLRGRLTSAYRERNAALARIPNFWRDVILRHPSSGDWGIHSADRQILTFLKDFYIIPLNNARHSDEADEFRLQFVFSGVNPYFTRLSLHRDVRRPSYLDEWDDNSADRKKRTFTCTGPDWNEVRKPDASVLGLLFDDCSCNEDGQELDDLACIGRRQRADRIARTLRDYVYAHPFKLFDRAY